MDCYVQAWNNHRVRSINENRRSILGHIPEAAFQMHERLFNGLGPPLVNEAQNARFLALSSDPVETIAPVTHQDNTLPVPIEAAEVVGLQAHEEFSTTHTVLQNSIVALRDRAYYLNSGRFDDVNKYLLHLNLTVECAAAIACSELSFLEFFLRRSLEHSIGPR